MTNQESYLNDLVELREAINALLNLVPVGKTKKELTARETAEKVASAARATIACMGNDYYIAEV